MAATETAAAAAADELGIPEALRRKEPLTRESYVPIGCYCDPPKDHGPHFVQAYRVMKGGDLHGKVYVGPVTLELLQEAEGVGDRG